ncbi:MAG TPA: hypothetical protein V6D28_01020, partial [Leptolyngbyaceae cyanobacterium]
MNRLEKIQQIVVTAQQMRDIEGGIFAAGMPVAALMEKVAGLITKRIQSLYPFTTKEQHSSENISPCPLPPAPCLFP